MTRHNYRTVLLIAGIVSLVALGSARGEDLENLRLRIEPPQRLDVPFRIFHTENMWNQLLLDTRTGQVWQLAFTVNADGVRARLPINLTSLASGKDAAVCRFFRVMGLGEEAMQTAASRDA
jgi:uncharacterized protein (DUF2141 family)